jgi:hypothetical protein
MTKNDKTMTTGINTLLSYLAFGFLEQAHQSLQLPLSHDLAHVLTIFGRRAVQFTHKLLAVAV